MHFNVALEAATCRSAIVDEMLKRIEARGDKLISSVDPQELVLVLRRVDDVYGDSRIIIDSDVQPLAAYSSTGRVDSYWTIGGCICNINTM
jgi:hypothetical protein